MKTKVWLSMIGALCAATALLAGVSPAFAQLPANATVVASGLNAPRGLHFGPDGHDLRSGRQPLYLQLRCRPCRSRTDR
jgi:hypothetical protein